MKLPRVPLPSGKKKEFSVLKDVSQDRIRTFSGRYDLCKSAQNYLSHDETKAATDFFFFNQEYYLRKVCFSDLLLLRDV